MADTTTTSTNTSTRSWQERAEEKRKRVQGLIPDAWKLPLAADTTATTGGTEQLQLQLQLQYPLDKVKNNLIELDIPRRSGILTAKELQITEGRYPVGRLLEALSSGELTSLEVTIAFCKRAAIAQQLVRTIQYITHLNACHITCGLLIIIIYNN